MRQATMDFFNDMEDHGSTMAMEAQTRSQLQRPARLPQQNLEFEVPHNSLLAVETKIQTLENFNDNCSIGEEKTCKFEANVDLEDEDEEEDYEEEEDDEKSNGKTMWITSERGFER
ncbi:hypothetical protein C1H46_022934 [Malus baccata]|uniref:Uncharacterized protein n=1 Tax=Malus baccata TaxID=106549 RepID=A0A540LYB6_MALBA|nr:hypothetical protein C1H46_022934 [Malus baccata]